MINKNIYLLGATGSIGSQVLDVIKNTDFCLKTLACGKNIKRLEEILTDFHPEYVSVADEADYIQLVKKYPNIKFGFGDEGLLMAAIYNREEKGTLINAVVGLKGLIPTIEAIKIERDILLANKETLVVGGTIIKDLLKSKNCKLIPVDSEHNAIARLLYGKDLKTVKRIIITASGGSFLNRSRAELEDVTVKDALNHPNWSMGSKITVDSATMVNKGLEVIEAHYLFDIDYDKIATIIHPESIVHGMVEFIDNSVTSLMYMPSMINPISYAIYGSEMNNNLSAIDFEKVGKLTFKEMDYNRFPMIKLAYEVGKKGGIMPLVYNSSNEIAVELFLNNKIKFLDIEKIIVETVKKYDDYIMENYLDAQQLVKLDEIIKKNIIDEVNGK